MIAFMGEERVLRGGDNVPVATTEASLSEIKHDEPPCRPGGVRRGDEEYGGNFTLPSRFSSSSPFLLPSPLRLISRLSLENYEGGAKRALVFTRAILASR